MGRENLSGIMLILNSEPPTLLLFVMPTCVAQRFHSGQAMGTLVGCKHSFAHLPCGEEVDSNVCLPVKRKSVFLIKTLVKRLV